MAWLKDQGSERVKLALPHQLHKHQTFIVAGSQGRRGLGVNLARHGLRRQPMQTISRNDHSGGRLYGGRSSSVTP